MAMPRSAELRFDAATAIGQGRREHQEDTVVADFPAGAGIGFAVLADGMGGHAAGDVASRIVATEVFAELKLQFGEAAVQEAHIGEILRRAAIRANNAVLAHTRVRPGTAGMGATLVAPVLIGDRLHWVSVGDSPLYLYRGGTLLRLNQDHSMVPQIDYLVQNGLMAADEALHHPDRNCLTSVLAGKPITQVDCPAEPVRLFDGDIVVAASDGLQFLDDDSIAAALADAGTGTGAEIAARLMRGIEDLGDPDQDNIALCVIRVSPRNAARAAAAMPLGRIDEAPVPPRAAARKSVTVMAAVGRSRTAMSCRITSDLAGRP
jgi:PPM family protein phosphatase